jgi:hypothetical protein
MSERKRQSKLTVRNVEYELTDPDPDRDASNAAYEGIVFRLYEKITKRELRIINLDNSDLRTISRFLSAFDLIGDENAE